MQIDWPENLSYDCVDLIMGLLESDVSKRLGCGDKNMTKLKSHSWFKQIDFEKLENKEIIAPFVPTPKDLESMKFFDNHCIVTPVNESVAFENFEIFPKWS